MGKFIVETNGASLNVGVKPFSKRADRVTNEACGITSNLTATVLVYDPGVRVALVHFIADK